MKPALPKGRGGRDACKTGAKNGNATRGVRRKHHPRGEISAPRLLMSAPVESSEETVSIRFIIR